MLYYMDGKTDFPRKTFIHPAYQGESSPEIRVAEALAAHNQSLADSPRLSSRVPIRTKHSFPRGEGGSKG